MLRRSASKLRRDALERHIMTIAISRSHWHLSPEYRGLPVVFLDQLVQNFGATTLVASLAIALLAGFVKGAVGFAMPMIMIGGLGSFMPPQVALAGLLLPTLVTNFRQMFRSGFGAGFAELRKYWRYNLVFAVTIILSAQLVVQVPAAVVFVILGVVVVVFGSIQLAGVRITIAPHRRRRAEVALAVVSGVIGGMSGVWGPPLILYLLALDLPKEEQTRALGVTFLLGAIILVAAHLKSGVLNAQTLPFSALLLVPALAGLVLGGWLHDRLDQQRFRRLTLFVLVIVGLNLLRRGVFG